MNEQMSQDQIDDLLKEIMSDNGSVNIRKPSREHLMVCIYCRQMLESEKGSKTHVILGKSASSHHGCSHFYVSRQWLLWKKANYGIAGWRRKESLDNYT